ncbi:hypothetical protein AAFF_G00349170 [Aldrovandia affinis]|uniref:Uncharacterized protein n=1 Tax=Aldrovandia affinis TaxID=143900 RepID=A0AAD7SJ54_9TELE|nr:hypothetical protein AAFF_G00349170 [Aldrovandia affinis]
MEKEAGSGCVCRGRAAGLGFLLTAKASQTQTASRHVDSNGLVVGDGSLLKPNSRTGGVQVTAPQPRVRSHTAPRPRGATPERAQFLPWKRGERELARRND